MIIKWLYRKDKTDSALMGEVIGESEKWYTAIVTSWSHKKYSHLEGSKMLVRRDIAQIDKMRKICPQCNQLADHAYNGIQSGLPMRENGKLYLYDVPLYTCEKCGSTWVDVDNRTNKREVK